MNACRILTQRLEYFLKKTIKVLTKKCYSVEYACLQLLGDWTRVESIMVWSRREHMCEEIKC